MFIGEFLCVLPLLWNYLNAPTKGRPSYLSRLLAREGEEGYSPVPAQAEDDDDASVSSTETEVGQTRMRGFAAFWLWFPAFFDSESRSTSWALLD